MNRHVVFLFCLLFLFPGCNEKEVVKKGIPDAENSIITEDGRLFVTGVKNLYEIFKTDENFESEKMFLNDINCLGLAEYENYLYVLVMETKVKKAEDINMNSITEFVKFLSSAFQTHALYKGKIRSENGEKIDKPEFSPVYFFKDFLITNGMTCSKDGVLYITDSTYLPGGKIVKIDLKKDNLEAEVWLDGSDNVFSPNGICCHGGYIYFSDFNSSDFLNVKTLIKRASMETGKVETLFQRPGGLVYPLSLFDDLCVGTLKGNDVVISTDYTRGTLVFLSTSKEMPDPVYETSDYGFAHPSSVNFGKGVNFLKNELIITEKGLIMLDPGSDYGNKVVKIKID